MTELSKTLVFAGIALVAIVVAIVASPGLREKQDSIEQVGLFFPDLEDAKPAGRLLIVTVDEKLGTLGRFEVVKKNRLWTMPMKSDYPADAAEHVAEATTALQILERLSPAGEDRTTHVLYSLGDPEKAELGTTGVGTLVRMEDEAGNPLAEIVIGKAVPDRSDLRYVRKRDEDAVFVSKVDMTKFSTDIEDWIDKRLFDAVDSSVKEVRIKHNRFEYDKDAGRFNYGPVGSADLAYDGVKREWSLASLTATDQTTGESEEILPNENEEPNSVELSGMLTALTGLQVVDVMPRPTALAGKLSLKVALNEAFSQDELISLYVQGFVPQPRAPQQGLGFDISAGEADISFGTNEGVRYRALIGSIAAGLQGDRKSADAKDKKKKNGQKDGDAPDKPDSAKDGRKRYLMVAVEFDAGLIPEPEYEPEPEGEGANHEQERRDHQHGRITPGHFEQKRDSR